VRVCVGGGDHGGGSFNLGSHHALFAVTQTRQVRGRVSISRGGVGSCFLETETCRSSKRLSPAWGGGGSHCKRNCCGSVLHLADVVVLGVERHVLVRQVCGNLQPGLPASGSDTWTFSARRNRHRRLLPGAGSGINTGSSQWGAATPEVDGYA
jgi:hypothetical protein